MGWRRKRLKQEKRVASRSAVPEPQQRNGTAQARQAPAGIDALRDARLTHPANAGQRAGIVQAGQQALGNRTVQRLLRSPLLQAKLSVGAADDAYEREADRVAGQVMRMTTAPALQRQAEPEEEEEASPAERAVQTASLVGQITPLVQRQAEPEEEEEALQSKPRAGQAVARVQRQVEPEEEEEEEALQSKPRAGQAVARVQRQVEPEEEEEEEALQSKPCAGQAVARVQRQAEPEEEEEEETTPAERAIQAKRERGPAAQVAPDVAGRIESLRGTGLPLSPAQRVFFEPRLGYDLGAVRVHSDGQAAETAGALQSRAYTLGPDVVFGAGQYDPESPDGQELLAHELTHVVQQGAASPLRRPASLQPVPAAQAESGVARQALPWSQRVAQVLRMRSGPARDQAAVALIAEALGAAPTVHVKTNRSRTTKAAAQAGQYSEFNNGQDLNYDGNLNHKRDARGLFGVQVTTRVGRSHHVYVVLGPKALSPVGPQVTRAAYDHEKAHAERRYREIQAGRGVTLNITAAEELEVYTQGFKDHFLKVVAVDLSKPEVTFGDTFDGLLQYYRQVKGARRQRSFREISTFYTTQVQGTPDHLLKFRLWLQDWLQRKPTDPLVRQLNALPGLGLGKKNTNDLWLYAGRLTHHLMSEVVMDPGKGQYGAPDYGDLLKEYAKAPKRVQDVVFGQIRDYYSRRVRGSADNLARFKIWLQHMLNGKPTDPLLKRVNGLPGLSLSAGTDPGSHLPRGRGAGLGL